jgi:hypothetical protein
MVSIEAIVQQVLRSFRLGDILAHYGKEILAHVAMAFGLVATGLVITVFAVAYGSWSIYVAAEPKMGAPWAALLVTVILIIIAGLCFLAGWCFIRREPKPKVPKEAPPAAAGGGLPISVEDAEMIIRLLKDRVDEDPIAATVVSLCSGYNTGAVLFRK